MGFITVLFVFVQREKKMKQILMVDFTEYKEHLSFVHSDALN
jgi:hypothetical protein